MSFLSRVTISWMFFFRHAGAHSPKNRKFPRQNVSADTLQNTKQKRKIRSCTKSLFVFGRVSLRMSARMFSYFSSSARCRRGCCTCHQILRALFTSFRKKVLNQSDMQVDSLNLHVALVHGAVVWVMGHVLWCSTAHHNMSS